MCPLTDNLNCTYSNCEYSSVHTHAKKQIRNKTKCNSSSFVVFNMHTLSGFQDTCDSHIPTLKGLTNDTNFFDGMFLSYVKEHARTGDKNAREILNNLIIPYFYLDTFPQISRQITKDNRLFPLNIGMFPDIYVILLRTISSQTAPDDEFVNFIRACAPVLTTPKRIQKYSMWSENQSQSLITLLQCCIPSLLSLYTDISTKDVDFEVRVIFFGMFSELISGTHSERWTFLENNKALVRTCFTEYIMFFICHVTPFPSTKSLRHIDFLALYKNSFNSAQQLRVDINMAYGKLLAEGKQAQSNKNLYVYITEAVKNSCQVMLERSVRLYKAASMHKDHFENEIVHKKKLRITRTNTTASLRECIHYLNDMPNISDFAVFESYCVRNHIEYRFINVLWDAISCVQVYEISTTLLDQQITSLSKQYIVNSQEVSAKQTLLVCLCCSQFNNNTTFRYDTRHNKYQCSRCDINDTVVEINMLGRIVVVNKIALVLSTKINKIVVYNGVLCGGCLNLPEIEWDKLRQFSTLQYTLKHTSLLTCVKLISNSTDAEYNNTNDTLSDFYQRRFSGDKSYIKVNKTKAKCAFCRSMTITERYLLVDVYNMQIVSVPVCYKHTLPKYSPDIRTFNINTFGDMIDFKTNNKRIRKK